MMKRPNRKPLREWDTPHHYIELHKQKAGFTVWTFNQLDNSPWEWAVFEAQEDAERDVEEFYEISEGI
jgi:hypothetical protein